MYEGSSLYTQPLMTEAEFLQSYQAQRQFGIKQTGFFTMDRCRQYFKNDPYYKGEALEKAVVQRYESFQKQDQRNAAENKKMFESYQEKYKQVQEKKLKAKQQETLKYNQNKLHQGTVKASMIKYLTSSGQPQVKSDEVKWNSGGFAPAWIQLQLPQQMFIQHMTMKVNMLPVTGAVNYFIVFDGKNRINVNKNLKNGEWEDHWPSVKCSKIRITTVSSPSWVAWLDTRITMEVEWKDIDKIKKYCL